jgi:plasmid stability protein
MCQELLTMKKVTRLSVPLPEGAIKALSARANRENRSAGRQAASMLIAALAVESPCAAPAVTGGHPERGAR